MDIVVLILAAIFFFVVAVLFRSNEALDRVTEVEKEVAQIEKEMPKQGEGNITTSAAPSVQAAQTNAVEESPIDHASFPNPENVHMN